MGDGNEKVELLVKAFTSQLSAAAAAVKGVEVSRRVTDAELKAICEHDLDITMVNSAREWADQARDELDSVD